MTTIRPLRRRSRLPIARLSSSFFSPLQLSPLQLWPLLLSSLLLSSGIGSAAPAAAEPGQERAAQEPRQEPPSQESPAQQAPADLPVQGTSLLGRELRSQPPTPEQEAAIEEARRALAEHPGEVERVVALGQALAAVWRYREAIEVYDRGLAAHPDDPLLLRHRGHRYISLRDFARAEDDLERAAARDLAAPGSLPAATRFDIWYHLGLARTLRGDFADAAEAYLRCRETVADGDDESLVAVARWLHESLRRAGDERAARAVLEPIHGGMAVEENRAYLDLLRLYRGESTVEAIFDPEDASPLDLATVGYGVASWWLSTGEEERARELLERIAGGPYWPAFGQIAAEAELDRAVRPGERR